MGVYIKGMEMPKDCPMCPLAHWDAADNFTGCDIVCGKKYAMSDKEYADSNTRPNWCPLVFVPPHGDLIDKDALIKEIGKQENAMYEHGREFSFSFRSGGDVCTAWYNVEMMVEDAPTIIPAEEGET